MVLSAAAFLTRYNHMNYNRIGRMCTLDYQMFKMEFLILENDIQISKILGKN